LRRWPGEHELHATAIEKRKCGRRVEKMFETEDFLVEALGLTHIVNGNRDLLDA